MGSTAAMAADLEVTHWWTSGGESAAVAEFAAEGEFGAFVFADLDIVGILFQLLVVDDRELAFTIPLQLGTDAFCLYPE